MFKELKLTEDLTILTDTITDVDNEQLVKDIEYICEISKTTNIESKGIQSEIHITSHNIRKLKEIINDKIIAFFNLIMILFIITMIGYLLVPIKLTIPITTII